jgi:hypothetical protein
VSRVRIARLAAVGLLIGAAMAVALAAHHAGTSPLPRAAAPPRPVSVPAPDAAIGADAAVAIARADVYACILPSVEIPRDPRCDADASYPDCRWQLPDPEGELFTIWRSTTPDHRWARPGLITLVLATAREYQARWPHEHLTVGDLDAAGPRHQTHDRGVDVDLYLEHAMLDVNTPGNRYEDNYAHRSPEEVASLRERVTDLAHILATCAQGRLRIYYNDPEVLTPFLTWFDAHGYVSDVGPAMTMHNRLHRFHFHVTVPENLPPIAR